VSFINRLLSMVNGPGIPFQNDTLFLTQNQALTTSQTTSLTALTPAVSQGLVRAKVYGGGTSPTLTGMKISVSDGTQFVCIFNSGVWATALTLDATQAGTAVATDGAMSATGVKILTSVTGAFTPAMVGQQIAVSTAGNAAGTVPLYTTVASYQSATQVTLAAGSVKTTAVSSATITLTGAYLNGGSAAAPAGFDVVVQFEVDLQISRVDVITTGAGISLIDIELSGTL
jgi:hypothetical protein